MVRKSTTIRALFTAGGGGTSMSWTCTYSDRMGERPKGIGSKSSLSGTRQQAEGTSAFRPYDSVPICRRSSAKSRTHCYSHDKSTQSIFRLSIGAIIALPEVSSQLLFTSSLFSLKAGFCASAFWKSHLKRWLRTLQC